MKTIKQLQEFFYTEYLKNRDLQGFCSDEIQNIAENMEGENGIKYNGSSIADIVYQSLDGYCMNNTESSCRESGFINGYEMALNDLLSELNKNNKLYKDDIIEYIKHLLTK